ncbi:MAG TPA: hypothetical protein V6C72_13920 [Chroococcales cyanobacterium]
MFSYHDLKMAMFCMEAGCGAIFVVIALVMLWSGSALPDCTSNTMAAMILFCVGIICLMFGFEAYHLRDDPEIWD